MHTKYKSFAMLVNELHHEKPSDQSGNISYIPTIKKNNTLHMQTYSRVV